MPDLDFKVIDAEAMLFAAAPTMLFKLHIHNAIADEQVHSIMLQTQIRIEATRRRYDAEAEGRLLEVFGEPRRWGETLRSLLWTHATTVVPRFTDSIVADLPIPCSYDFDVAAAKYFYALEDGEVPLLFLFSGTVFYMAGEGSLQITQISWEKEAPFRLPVGVWKKMMDHYFPNSAWLRVRKDVFDRLYAYKARQALPSWDDALDRLLGESEMEAEP
jgi:hypothetical protein